MRSASTAVFLAGLLLICFTAGANEPNPSARTLVGHTRSVISVAFTPDGKSLVSGSRDKTIKIWDIATGKCLRTLTNHKDGIYCITFSHDGTYMATASADQTIILWNTARFEPVRTLRGHTAALRYVAFSPDDKTLASAGEDRSLRLWDVASGRLKVTRLDHTRRVKTVAWFPDGKTLVTASSDRTLRLWDAQSAEPKQVLSGYLQGVEFCAVSPDGRQLFSGTANIGQIIFWDARSGKMLKDLPHAHGNAYGAEIDCGHYSPDGRWAVSGSKDRTDKFWDPKTFALLHTITGNPGRTESMCFSRDGKTLATGFGGGASTINLWDLSGWMKEKPPKRHS